MNHLIGFRDNIAAIGSQFPKMDFITAAGVRSDKIALTVVILKRTAIIPTGALQHLVQRLPRPGRIGCRAHEVTFVRRSEIDPEFLVVKANRAGPDALPVAVHFRPIHVGTDLIKIGHHMSQDRPVDQVLGMENHHAGRILKGGRDRVVVTADTNAIAVIRGHHGIVVSSVAAIAPVRPVSPFIRSRISPDRNRRQKEERRDREKEERVGWFHRWE